MTDKRDEYLRGISASAPERTVGAADYARSRIMQAAFDAVCNKGDWKEPINALIDPADPLKGLYSDAVEFMTGTKPEFFLTNIPAPNGGWFIRMVSEGYRLGPCGDH